MGELDADFNEGVLRGFLMVDSLWSLVIWLLHGCYGNAGICLCIRHVALFAFIQSKCLTYSLAGCWHSNNFYIITCSNCKIWWRRFFSCFSRSNKQTCREPAWEIPPMTRSCGRAWQGKADQVSRDPLPEHLPRSQNLSVLLFHVSHQHLWH